jgi:hypothetical protein
MEQLRTGTELSKQMNDAISNVSKTGTDDSNASKNGTEDKSGIHNSFFSEPPSETTKDSDIAGDAAVEVATTKPDAVSSLNVFYNIYLPADQDDDAIDKAINIIREQIGQVLTAMSTSTPTQAKRGTIVSYNTVGAAALNATWMDHLCAGNSSTNSIVQCRHMHHYDTAQEEQPLQSCTTFVRHIPTKRSPTFIPRGPFTTRLGTDYLKIHGDGMVLRLPCPRNA